MGGEQMSQGYQQELENEISELYCKKKQNQANFLKKFFLFFS